jgi:hypothetical protein
MNVMLAPRPLWLLVILLAVLTTLDGCRSTAHQQPPCDCEQAAAGAPGAPTTLAGQENEGGQFLRTGAIQLGPGVGRNQWRWQGDGESGF